MRKFKAAWTYCPDCSAVIVLSLAKGLQKSFSLGSKGKQLIAALMVEQLPDKTLEDKIKAILGSSAAGTRQKRSTRTSPKTPTDKKSE
jgi:hypothetical protein